MKKSLLLLPALVFGATFASAQVVVYTQPFTGANQTEITTLTNWGIASSSGLASESGLGVTGARQHGRIGATTEISIGFNAIPDTASLGNVAWFAGDLETPANPMSLAQGDVQSLSLTIGHSNLTNQTRWLVRIDNGGTDNWFVSRAAYSMVNNQVANAGEFLAEAETISDNFADLTWRPLLNGTAQFDGLINDASDGFTIIDDSANPAAVALPTGNITALGVYNWNAAVNTVTRFDDFTVTAVPEPSTYAALLGLSALGLAAWRSRRR
jgi:hypothetical protein